MALIRLPRNKRLAFAVVGALLLGAVAASFAIPYWLLRDEDPVTRAQGPAGAPDSTPGRTGTPRPAIDPNDTEVTPVPGSTPDTTQPFWFIPYVNADRKKLPFKGNLNGFEIDPDYVDRRTGFDACPGEGLTDPPYDQYRATVVQPGPFSIDPAKLPAGLTSLDGPWVFVCKRVEIWITQWTFSVQAGTPGANPGGGSISVTKTRGLRPIAVPRPSDRWSSATIAGRPAIVSGPFVTAEKGQFGSCMAFVYDRDHDVLTEVVGTSANTVLCVDVAEAVLR